MFSPLRILRDDGCNEDKQVSKNSDENSTVKSSGMYTMYVENKYTNHTDLQLVQNDINTVTRVRAARGTTVEIVPIAET